MPNYVLLRAFEAAARLESFTLAAKELHLTQSAIRVGGTHLVLKPARHTQFIHAAKRHQPPQRIF